MRRTDARRSPGPFALALAPVLACVLAGLAPASRARGAGGAGGDARTAKLAYSRDGAAAQCPDETVVRRAVRERLGRDPFSPSATETVQAAISGHDGVLHAEVRLVDAAGVVRGTRSLEAEATECDDLVDAIALAISVAIDPLVLERARPSSSGSASASASANVVARPGPATKPSATPPPSVATPTPELSLPRRVRYSAGLGVVGSTGGAPSMALGGTAFLGARAGSLGLGLELRADLPAGRDLLAGGRVLSSLYLLTLATCALTDAGAGTFGVCVVGSGGAFVASSEGLARGRRDVAPFVELGARALLELTLFGPTFVRAHGEISYDLIRNAVTVDGVTVFTQPRVAAAAGVGVGVRF
jgi:hypothetical protein